MGERSMRIGVVFLALLCTAAQAGAARQLRGIEVQAAGDGARIEMTLGGQVRPQVQNFEEPARLVMDLPETTSGMAQDTVGWDDSA